MAPGGSADGLVGLAGHGGGGGGGGLGVAEIVGRAHGEVVVEQHAVGDAGRDLERWNLVVGDPLEVLAQGPDGVAVGGHQHGAAVLGGVAQVGHDGRLPVGQRPADHVGQALGERDVGGVDVVVAGVGGHVVGVVGGERRGRGVVAAPPQP